MRFVLLLALATLATACHDEPLVCTPPPVLPEPCVEGGLAGIDLDGTWTASGEQTIFHPGEPRTNALSFSFTMQHTGAHEDGATCADVSGAPAPAGLWYVDRSEAYGYQEPQPQIEVHWYLCADASGTLLLSGVTKDLHFEGDILDSFHGVLSR
jgi:hypothetical protein